MTLRREEWEERKRRLAAKREAEREPYYRGLAQSEVGAKQLTNSPAWNWFLQLLAAARGNAEKVLDEINAEAGVSDDFSHENLARVQAARRAWHARIATLDEVIDLPRQILDDAGKAKEKLDALNIAETNGKTADPAAS